MNGSILRFDIKISCVDAGVVVSRVSLNAVKLTGILSILSEAGAVATRVARAKVNNPIPIIKKILIEKLSRYIYHF